MKNRIFNTNITSIIATLIILFLSSTVAQANDNVTRLYEVENVSSIYQEVALPYDAYRYSDSRQLNDLVVIDKGGNALPSRIVNAQQANSDEGKPIALNFFSILSDEQLKKFAVHRKTQLQIDHGAIEISMEPSSANSQDAHLFYLIDLSEQNGGLKKLELHWSTEANNQYLPVEISASDDLKHWTELASSTLVHLYEEDQELLRNTIDINLATQHYNYLRINFPANNEVKLTEVIGHQSAPATEPLLLQWQIEGKVANNQDSESNNKVPVAAWEYHRDTKVPVQTLNVDLGQISYSDLVHIYSRESQHKAWKLLYQGVLFNTQVGDTWQHSKAMTIAPNGDPFWRVELSSNLRDKASPKLSFQYPQQRVQFIANNNHPYYIALTAEIPEQRIVDQVFEQILSGKKVAWKSANIQRLADINKPHHSDTILDWKGLLFWGALVVAVVILLVLALRLYRQFQQEE